jgi:hypothetical protein
MADQKIVHCMYAEKFIEPFIGFLEKNFDANQHIFLIKKFQNYEVVARHNIKFLNLNVSLFREFITYSLYLNKAQKIIIHGLFNPRLVFTLFLHPWLLKKCYWIMWGGDLYFHELRGRTFRSNIYESMRAYIIKRFGHLVTYIKGDYELANKWYKTTGQYHDCFMYQSNLYKQHIIQSKQNSHINILVGNSANPTNNHDEIFKTLLQYKNEDIQIYCPLSYGDHDYASQVAHRGEVLFGNKFTPLLDFMPFEKYLELLGKIDIAIFAQRRQQGLGNIITLLGLGKKVFVRSDVVQWQLFNEIGIKVFDIEHFEITPLNKVTKAQNIIKTKDFFSEKKLIEQYSRIFE